MARAPRPADYLLLGVSPRSTPAELLSAFRRRARDLHPDRHPDDPDAHTRFQELTSAYEALARAVRGPTDVRPIPVVVKRRREQRPAPLLRVTPVVVSPLPDERRRP